MKTIQLIAVAVLSLAPTLARAEVTDSQTAVNEEVIAATGEVAASMTPAERHQQQVEQERRREGSMSKSPRMRAQSNSMKFPTVHHKEAYNSLSDKNKHAYNGLEDHEQDQVAESYRNGNNHQKTLTKILKKDQKEHNKQMKSGAAARVPPAYRHDKGMQNSPASQSMRNESRSRNKSTSKKKDDIFG